MIRALRLGIPVLAIALAVAMFGVTPALAAKGGNHHPPGTAPFLTVSSNLIASGSSYTVEGFGFTPNAQVNLVYYAPDCCLGSPKIADVNGHIMETRTAELPGTYKIVAMQFDGRSWTQVASISFDVK